ncbi:ABC-type transport system involved in multi-copper enzyme maturation permease subunit [Streptomyces aurantiacus]|nr:ABC-type transport system involved in multi-copper enzyme maturation permease subunit [Streptomyces aurantiacus]
MSSMSPVNRVSPVSRVNALRPLHAEWTKLRTLPSSWWLLAATVVLTLTVGAAAVSSVADGVCASAAGCHEDTVKLSLTGVWLGQATVLVLGALSMGAEYGTGTIRTTLTAVPRRVPLLASKAAVLAAMTAGAGAVAVVGSLGLGRLILPGAVFTRESGYPLPSFTDGPTLRAAFGSVLGLMLIALLGLGLAALLRDSAAAITTGLGLLYVVPLLADLLADPAWKDRLERWAPMPAGLAVQSTRDLSRLPIGPWPGLAVLAAYALGVLAVATAAFRARDA